ncbi:glutamate 5-kinase [Salibacterium qingdaonense]|uniref:Glutamate 5-kinase n=1 Tax=Salibacterium qingdaonense TaxID=266892 RepID=A0A1I4IV37_9BACI|nr:glutamate 5-kinase [Salibacterium qingdaonense]SFL58150.1 glutamate 5-kinase [Salibacterium qingdaonense]
MKKERVVIKIGSSSLTSTGGGLSRPKLLEFVEAAAALYQEGHQVVIISSGAVAAGFSGLKYPTRPVTLAGKQASAAVGQGRLMQAYTEAFRHYQIETGQILLTRDNFSNKSQYQNAYSTLTELLQRGVVPIINENDSIAVDELTFGDNDMLSALVGGLIHAECLMIITDINGIYDSNPNTDPNAKRYHFLSEIEDEQLEQAGGSGSAVGTGGMKSKLQAAKIGLSLGLRAFIGKAEGASSFQDILAGKGDGTYIGFPGRFVLNSKKQWLALHSLPAGEIIVDDGARAALLQKGRSLLPAGILEVHGRFERAGVVEVKDKRGNLIGKGQVNMSAAEIMGIKGKSSQEAVEWTETKRAEVIHRDEWVPAEKERKSQ